MRVLTAIRRDGGLRNPDRLGAYVYAVCNNVLLECYRSQKKHGPSDEDLPEQTDWRPDPESEYVSSERRSIVWKVLLDLSQKDRELLKAAFLEERDKEEICRRMGVDGDYLRVLLHRARGRFKAAAARKAEFSSISHRL